MDNTDQLITKYRSQGCSQSKISEILAANHNIKLTREAISARIRKHHLIGETFEKVDLIPPAAPGVTFDTKPIGAGISKEQLLQRYDLNYIVRISLPRLQKDRFLTTSELAKEINILGKPGYLTALSRSENTAYCGKAGKEVYWSHPESIAEMKAKHVLQPVNY